jgi:glycyl-tRNA synthetase beta chain
VVVALADKLETLAGLFGIGQLPTGDKDPFALRRHALGVIRMLVERDLPLSLPALVARRAATRFPAGHGQAQAEVTQFMFDRLVGSLREQGYSAQEVDAVLALRPSAGATSPSAWQPCAPSPRCPKRPRWRRPTSAWATS